MPKAYAISNFGLMMLPERDVTAAMARLVPDDDPDAGSEPKYSCSEPSPCSFPVVFNQWGLPGGRRLNPAP